MLFVDLFKFSALSLASNGKITIDDEFKKEVEVKSCLYPILRYYFTICTEVLKTMKIQELEKPANRPNFGNQKPHFSN